MRKAAYICRAEQTAWTKAYDGMPKGLLNQNSLIDGVNLFSKAHEKESSDSVCYMYVVSTDSANESKKCLVKWFFCNLVEEDFLLRIMHF